MQFETRAMPSDSRRARQDSPWRPSCAFPSAWDSPRPCTPRGYRRYFARFQAFKKPAAWCGSSSRLRLAITRTFAGRPRCFPLPRHSWGRFPLCSASRARHRCVSGAISRLLTTSAVLGAKGRRRTPLWPRTSQAGWSLCGGDRPQSLAVAIGGDPKIVGAGIRINGEPVEVIGVAQAGFAGASPTTAMAEIWIPTTAPARIAHELETMADRRSANFSVIGRLAGGVSYSQAEQALEPVVRQLEQIDNDPRKDTKERRVRLLPGGRMFPVRDEDLPRVMGFPLLLVALVLLMACGNVANLLLARSVARRREMAVRLSLGAGPGRIVRQLLTESLLLSLMGAAGGMLLAIWFMSVIRFTRPMISSYVHFESRLDWRSLLMAAVIAAGSSFVFGLIPALRCSRTNVYAGLTSRSASGEGGRGWFNMRNVLVFQQVAVSTVLLLLTGFVVVGWQRSAGAELRLRAGEPGTWSTLIRCGDGLPRSGGGVLREAGTKAAHGRRGNRSQLGTDTATGDVQRRHDDECQGRVRRQRQILWCDAIRAGVPGSSAAVGAQLRSGREFDDRDERDGSSAILVNETMACRVWPHQPAVGRQWKLKGRTREVIGVVGDIQSAFPLAPKSPAMFEPATPSGSLLRPCTR